MSASPEQENNITYQSVSSVQKLTILEKALETNSSLHSANYNNTLSDNLQPRMQAESSLEYHTIQAPLLKQSKLRSSSQGGADPDERQSNLPKLPTNFGFMNDSIQVGGNMISTNSVMTIENEARIPQRFAPQHTKGYKTRQNQRFSIKNPSVTTQFKGSLNADLSGSPLSIQMTTNNTGRKQSLQVANSMLSAKQSNAVSKRLISMKNDRDSSEGKLVSLQAQTGNDLMVIQNSDERSHVSLSGTSKLHDLRDDKLMKHERRLPGVRQNSGKHIKRQNYNSVEIIQNMKGSASNAILQLKKNQNEGIFKSIERHSLDQSTLLV